MAELSTRVFRLCPRPGQRQWAVRDRDGFFVLAPPDGGREKHHAANKRVVRDEDEMIRLIAAGCSVRVQTSTAPSLVNLNIHVDGVRVR